MAGHARERGLEVEVATFETWATNGRAFDTIVAGQAWHWVDPVAGATKGAAIDAAGGGFTMGFTTLAVTAPRQA